MKSDDLAAEMHSKLNASKEMDSSDFKLKVILECLNKAADCFEQADKPNCAKKITKLMEKLSSKF